MTRKRKWDYTTDHQEQITTNLRQGRVWNWGIRYSFNFTPEQSAASRARRLGKGLGPRPHTWKTGPDPELKHLRRRWLRAKNQARFWSQEWRLTWEQYRDTWAGHTDQLGRTNGSLNLVRRCTGRPKARRDRGPRAWVVDCTNVGGRNDTRTGQGVEIRLDQITDRITATTGAT